MHPFCGGVFQGYSDRFHNEVYYSILSNYWVIRGYSKCKWFLYRFVPVLGSWKNVFRIFFDYPSDYLVRQKYLGDAEIQKMLIDRIQDWKSLTGIDIRDAKFTEENIYQLKKNMSLLKDIVHLSKKLEIESVIITPPIIDAFYNVVSDEFWRRGYKGPLCQLADMEEINFIDFCGERLFGDDTGLFQGIDFLNSLGRKKLTMETLTRLKGIGIL